MAASQWKRWNCWNWLPMRSTGFSGNSLGCSVTTPLLQKSSWFVPFGKSVSQSGVKSKSKSPSPFHPKYCRPAAVSSKPTKLQ